MNINNVTLHDLHIEDLQNPLHPSSFEVYKDYRILVLRLPEKKVKKTKDFSYGFIITEEQIYHYNKEEQTLVPFPDGIEGLHLFLDTKIDTLMHHIDTVAEKILSLEENLYKKLDSSFMDRWHSLKNELSHTERTIIKALSVFGRFIEKSKSSEHFLLNEFNDLHEHMERTLRSNITANEQLDNLYQYYTLRSNDRLNRSLYILTVISVIFLPLNLVVGFFGMNTGGLPFQAPFGTLYAFATMIIFAALLTTAVLWKIKKE